jgi:hypothetical protein
VTSSAHAAAKAALSQAEAPPRTEAEIAAAIGAAVIKYDAGDRERLARELASHKHLSLARSLGVDPLLGACIAQCACFTGTKAQTLTQGSASTCC